MDKPIMNHETPKWNQLLRKKANRFTTKFRFTRKSLASAWFYCYCFRAKRILNIDDFSKKKYDDDFSISFSNLFDGGIDFSEALQTLFNN